MTYSICCDFNENHLVHEKTSLPSPPNSSCGDEREPEITTTTTTTTTSLPLISITQQHTADISENYTIDHSKPNAITQEKYTHSDYSAVLSTIPSSLKRSLSSSTDEDTSDMDDDATARPKRKRSTLSDTQHCSQCGKLYKHFKSLIKHQWEHSEYWEASSKLSLTKHQQVQMLEAASILTSMKKQMILNQETDSDSSDDSRDQQEEIGLTW